MVVSQHDRIGITATGLAEIAYWRCIRYGTAHRERSNGPTAQANQSVALGTSFVAGFRGDPRSRRSRVASAAAIL